MTAGWRLPCPGLHRCQAAPIALGWDAMGYHYAFCEVAQGHDYSNFTIMRMPLRLSNVTSC